MRAEDSSVPGREHFRDRGVTCVAGVEVAVRIHGHVIGFGRLAVASTRSSIRWWLSSITVSPFSLADPDVVLCIDYHSVRFVLIADHVVTDCADHQPSFPRVGLARDRLAG
jgi:hypothetical protein